MPDMPSLLAESLRQPGIRHGFFGRQGGVSSGAYASLNCALTTGDRREDIDENRRRVAVSLGAAPDQLASVYQVHGAEVAEVTAPWALHERPKADAMVTRTPGVALGILTADCGPLLFADAKAGVIGAAHAGWRGAKAGVAEATVAAMVRLGASPAGIDAAIGPCIGPDSYEVGPEFPRPFLEEDAANGRFFRPAVRTGHSMFDLGGYLAARLERLGLRSVARLAADTCADGERFFSYRRTCLEGGKAFGCQVSAIALPA